MLEIQTGKPPLVGNRFEILGAIDETGYTLQYLAWDRDEEQWVMVRVLSYRASRDPLQRARFEREVKTHRRLDHPNLLRIVSADAAHPRFPWMATEVAEGGSVADWMGQNGPLPAYLAIDVMADVCSGLRAAHRAKTSHGAIRTTSVLINGAGKCVVSGLVGGGDEADVLGDVRGAGALLYTMMTGQTWDDKRALTLLGALPPVLARVVERARKGRGGYADVAALSRDLEAAVLSLPTPDGTVPPLAGPDAQLPEDPATLWDGTTQFPLLEELAKVLEDPDHVPQRPSDLPRETTSDVPRPVAHDAQPAAAAGDDGHKAAIPYQMSRGTQSGDFNPEMYARGNKPLYEEPPPKSEKQEWTYEPEGKKEEKPEEAEADKPMLSEATLVKLVAGAVLFLFLAVVGTIGLGAKAVGEVRVVSDQAASALVSHVRGEADLVYELAREGADRKKLEDAYFEFSEAKNEIARTRAAHAYAVKVLEEATAHGLDPASSSGTATPLIQRVEKLSQVDGEFLARRNQWAQAASGFPGVLSVWIGLQQRPNY